jgi:hypothetical protein
MLKELDHLQCQSILTTIIKYFEDARSATQAVPAGICTTSRAFFNKLISPPR